MSSIKVFNKRYLNISLSRRLSFRDLFVCGDQTAVDDGQEELVVEDPGERGLGHGADLPQGDAQTPNTFWRGITHPGWDLIFFIIGNYTWTNTQSN